MAIWYVAPDDTTNPLVTLANIGDVGYGTSWTQAVKWSDINNGVGSLWQTLLTNNDTVKFLPAGYNLADVAGGWTALAVSKTNLTLKAELASGPGNGFLLGFAIFTGTRPWPWPQAGGPGAETMFRLTANVGTLNIIGLSFHHMSYPVTPASPTAGTVLGTVAFTDCKSLNTEGGLLYTNVRTDGLVNVSGTRSKAKGYSSGNFRVWGSITTVDCVFDSEFQSTNLSASNAQATSGAHVMDAQPAYSTTTWPMVVTRCIGKNHAAGQANVAKTLKPNGATAITFQLITQAATTSTGSITSFGTITAAQLKADLEAQSNIGEDKTTVTGPDGSGNFAITFDQSLGKVTLNVTASTGGTGPAITLKGDYPQGDAFIAEENGGIFTGKDILTYANGDRGVDLKANGTVIRHVSLGDNTAGIAHHLDTSSLAVYQSLYRTGKRPAGVTNASACVQSSGIVTMHMCVLIANPTAAQTFNNNIAISKADADLSKIQMSIYGSVHVGQMTLIDCWGYFSASTGATKQTGYAGSTDNARTAAVFGLTPTTTVSYKIRSCAQDQSQSPLSAATSFTLHANGGGETTGPATPTGLTVVGTTSSTVTLSFNQVAPDAGTAIQGYILFEEGPGDSGFVPLMPGKSASPVVFAGLKPASSYQYKIASYDCNGNLSALSSAVTATTAAGSTDTSTPSVPLSPAVAASYQLISGVSDHPSMAALQWNAPATGTVAFNEIVDASSSAVVARSRSIPNTSTVPSYTESNVTLASV